MPKAGLMTKNTWKNTKFSTDWSLELVQAESEGQGRVVNGLNVERGNPVQSQSTKHGRIFFLIPPPPPLLLSFLFIPVFKEIFVKTVAEYKLKRQGLQGPHRMKNIDIIEIVYKSH